MSEPVGRLASPPILVPRAVRGVAFDLDGTLIDSYGAIAESLNAARRHFGLDELAESSVRRLVGHGLEALMRQVLGAERAARGVEIFRARYAEIFAERTHALPHARETLLRLCAAGLRCSVASNKPSGFSRAILEGLDLLPFMDTVQGPDLAGTTKPEPEIIRRCLGAMGVGPMEGLYVGDMVLDVESGSRAGVSVVLVAGGSSDAEELRATGQPVLETLAALPPLLQQSSTKPDGPDAPRANAGRGIV